MERRDALKYTALFMGVGLSASTVSAILSGCKVDESDHWVPTFFTRDENRFMKELAETMLPRTNTPGARDAKVDRYIDTIRPLRYTIEENQLFKERLNSFIAEAKSSLGKDFHQVEKNQRLEWLTAIDKVSYDTLKADPEMEDDRKPFYLSLKEQILAGYFNAEIVAREYFAFDPIPGRYDACIPFEEVGKTWAL